MFDLINGLPVHPLVVHAVVVLLPLAAVGTVAIAIRPRWRRKYGVLVVAAAGLSAVLLPVATSSGEALEKRVGDPGHHAALGEQLIWFAIPLLALAAALTYLSWRADPAEAGAAAAPSPATDAAASRLGWTRAVAVLAVVAALATAVQVYRVGDSGARAAWGDQVGSSSSASSAD
ncbi:MAG TPA: DUF2231 domain-containing protein [Nocardioides sp.]|nr:DUF2231 domain-containing protein [Nocardioides sp.]